MLKQLFRGASAAIFLFSISNSYAVMCLSHESGMGFDHYVKLETPVDGNSGMSFGFVSGDGSLELCKSSNADSVTQNASVYTVNSTVACDDGSTKAVEVTYDEQEATLEFNGREYNCN